jgi:hypothetical protein
MIDHVGEPMIPAALLCAVREDLAQRRRPLDPASVYRNIVLKYGLETGISAEVNGLCLYFTGTIGGAYEVPGNIIQGPPECGSVEKIAGSSFWLGFGEPSCVSNLSRGVHNDYLIPTTIHSRSVSCSTLV